MHAPQSDVADQDRAIKQPAAIADGAEIAFSAGNKAIIRLVIVDTGDQPDSGRAGARRVQAIGLVLFNIVQRSEEHTSELQSLMRISYAVFCLKKKNRHKINNCKNNKNKVNTNRE